MTLTKGAKARAVPDARTRVACDDMFFAQRLVRLGAGIAALPSFVGDPDVATGDLVRCMPGWVAHTGGVYLVQQGRKHVPRKVTAFRDLLLEMLRQRPLAAVD
jgi:DNA-binding transcriptional LysR family regulator